MERAKTRITRPLAAVVASGLMITLVACGESTNGETTPSPSPTETEAVQVEGKLPSDAGELMAQLSEPLLPLAMAAADPGATNPVYSPVSVYLALALTGNGARGETATQFEDLLGGGMEQVNEVAAGMMAEYASSTDELTLAVANSLWLETGFKLDAGFGDTAKAVFGAEPEVIDLQKEGKDKINAWVDEKTNHLIKEIIGEVSPDAVAYLVNALYMKAAWAKPFEEIMTGDEPFTLADGSTIEVPTMVESDLTMPYFKSDDAEGLVIPYEGDRFAMLAVMPTGGLDQVDWDGTRISTWLGQAERHEAIELHLPKWEAEMAVTLNDPLMDLGLTNAFNENADLTGLGQAPNAAPMFISNVSHKAVVKVDEVGTEAAAVTSVGIEAMAAPPPAEPTIVRFDKPFVFVIVDLDSSVPLFIGQVTDPTAG